MRDLGIYIHFPYCRARCPYCDFRVDVVRSIPHRAYASAVVDELIARDDAFRDRRLRSIYFGGGTPSLWETDALAYTLEQIRSRATALAPTIEITVEVNPSSASHDQLKGLFDVGVNRVSVGVQSFDDETLSFLGRWHSAAEARKALEIALNMGFESVSFDLIAGIPDRTLRDWKHELSSAAAFSAADHMSIYELTYHQGTALWRQLQKGRFRVIPDDLAIAIFRESGAQMAAQGRPRYEISNYAVPGKEAIHNSGYWSGREYLGLGIGAHSLSYREAEWSRGTNHGNVAEYLAAPHLATKDGRALPLTTLFEERVFLGLRTVRGVDLAAISGDLGTEIPPHIQDALVRAVAQGLLHQKCQHFTPTEEGFLLADTIAVDVIDGSTTEL